MKSNLYSIYDRKSAEFGLPFAEKNEATAKRRFCEFLKQNPFKEDMSLYCVGGFDSDEKIPFISSEPVFVSDYDLTEVNDDAKQHT